jgi:hypothetical protein
MPQFMESTCTDISNPKCFKDIRDFVVKIAFLSDTTENDYSLTKTTVILADFKKEARIQYDIYNAHVRNNSIVPATTSRDPIIIPIDMAEAIITQIGGADLNTNRNSAITEGQATNVGIIIMELADTYETIIAISEKLRDPTKKQLIDNYARFALMNLAIDYGYIHGDAHRGNIMLSFTAGGMFKDDSISVKLIDFGRARIIQDNKKALYNPTDIDWTRGLVHIAEKTTLHPANTWIDKEVTDPTWETSVVNVLKTIRANYNLQNEEFNALVKTKIPTYQDTNTVQLFDQRLLTIKAEPITKGECANLTNKDGIYNPAGFAAIQKRLDAAAKLWDHNHEIDTSKYSTVYITSDIHADILKIIQLLQKEELITPLTDPYTETDLCSLVTTLQWNEKKKNTLLIIVGDLVDGRRTDEVKDTLGSFELLLHILLYNLRVSAMNYGSNVLFTIGNHDYMTVVLAPLDTWIANVLKMVDLYVHTSAKKYFLQPGINSNSIEFL